MEFFAPKLIQSFIWPAVLEGFSVVGVAPKREGKTMAHLIPILSLVFQPSLYASLPKSNGPFALILTSSWVKVKAIFAQVSQLIGSAKLVRANFIYGGGREEAVESSLLNGCEILVSTPSCLLRMIKKEIVFLDRLCHLVLDDGDILVEDFTPEIREVMTHYLDVRPLDEGMHQFLLFGTQWTPGMRQFCDVYMENVRIIVTDKFEAALYGGVKQVAHVCGENQRAEFVLNLLSSTSHGKTLIVTQSATDAILLHQVLYTSSVFAYLAHEGQMTHDVDQVYEDWSHFHKKDSQPVLVATDKVLQQIPLSDAEVVIHYDIPSKKNGLGLRLWCTRKCFKRPICDQNTEVKKSQCVSHFLVTPSCIKQAPHLIQILQRSQSTIPTQLTQLASQTHDKETKFSELCTDFKMYGECRNIQRCGYRHVLNQKQDSPGGAEGYVKMPTTGNVKVLVTHVRNASRIYVRLVEHRDHESKTTKYGGDYAILTMSMNMHFCDPNKRKIVDCTILKVGDLCAIEDLQHTFHRIQVKELSRPNKVLQIEEAMIKYIDTGGEKTVQTSELYVLPEDLGKIPFQAVEVYICRVKPVDNDTEWTDQAEYFMEDLLRPVDKSRRKTGKELEGRIVLSLGNCLWLDPIIERKELAEIGAVTNNMNIRDELLRENFAVENPLHIDLLYAACSGKVDLPEVLEPVDTPTIALNQLGQPIGVRCVKFPEKNKTEFVEFVKVVVKHVDDPGLFFIHLVQNQHRYDDLLDEIEDCMKLSGEEPQPGIKPGTMVLSRHPQEEHYRWLRGKVMEVKDGKYDILFLDHGEREYMDIADVRAMPSRFRYLPFQALECALAHVQPKGKGWEDEDADKFWDLTYEEDDDEDKILLAKVISTETAGYIGSTKYIIELYDTIPEYDVNINQELVALGHAKISTSYAKEHFLSLNMGIKKFEADHQRIPLLCVALLAADSVEGRELIAGNIRDIVQEGNASELFAHGGLRSLCQLVGYLEDPGVFDTIMDCIVLITKGDLVYIDYEVIHNTRTVNCLCRILARVLRSGDALMEETTLWALSELSVKDMCASEIYSCGGLRLLSKVLMTSTNELSLEVAARTLTHLMCDSQNVPDNDIIDYGVIEAVDHQLNITRSSKVQVACLTFIQLLADRSRFKDKFRYQGTLGTICELLKSEDVDSSVVIGAFDCLSVLVSECPENREALISNGIGLILESLTNKESPISEYSIQLMEMLERTPSKSSNCSSPSMPSLSPIIEPLAEVVQSAINSNQPKQKPLGRAGRIFSLLNKDVVLPGIRRLPKKQTILGKRIPNKQKVVTRRALPQCKWCQDRWNILLSVQVKDVPADADVASFSDKTVKFRAESGEVEYWMEMELYERINPELCEVKISASEVQLGLRKVFRGRWPRLLKEKEKMRLLTVDFDRLVDSSSSSEDEDKEKEHESPSPPLLSPIKSILSKSKSIRQLPVQQTKDSSTQPSLPGVPDGFYKENNEESSTPSSDVLSSDEYDNDGYYKL